MHYGILLVWNQLFIYFCVQSWKWSILKTKAYNIFKAQLDKKNKQIFRVRKIKGRMSSMLRGCFWCGKIRNKNTTMRIEVWPSIDIVQLISFSCLFLLCQKPKKKYNATLLEAQTMNRNKNISSTYLVSLT